MLSWLAFGEHEALKRDMKRARILIPAEGKPTIPLRVYPADSRDNSPPPLPLGSPKCFVGYHLVIMRLLKGT